MVIVSSGRFPAASDEEEEDIEPICGEVCGKPEQSFGRGSA